MYYPKNNIYINEDKSILFDLNDIEIYQIDENAFNVFEKIYSDVTNINKEDKTEMDIYNCFFNKSSKKNQEDYKITSVRINVSNMCNFKCRYCFASHGNYSKEDKIMDVETAKKICNYIKTNLKDVKDIGFFGGEPLLNIKAIEIICNEMKNDENNIKFNMITNLSILNEDIINLIKKYNIQITVSLDGDKEINDINRISKNNMPTYDLVSKNIKKLLDNNYPISMIESTYTSFSNKKYSKADISQILSDEFNTKHIYIADVDSSSSEFQIPYNNVYDKNNMARTIDFIFKNIESNKLFLTCIEAKPLISFVSKDKSDHFCLPGITTALFDENEYIWPCQAFIGKDDFRMGDISNVLDNNLYFKSVQNKLLNFRKSNYEKCKNCISQYWCQSCISSILSDDGNYLNIKNDICTRNIELTKQTLEKIALYVNNNKFNTLLKNISSMRE